MRIALASGLVALSLNLFDVRLAAAQATPQRCAELRASAERYESEGRLDLLNELLRLRAAECPTAAAFFEAGIALIRVNATVDASDAQASAPKATQRWLLAMNYLEESMRRKDPPLSSTEAATATYQISKLQSKLALVRLVPSDTRERFNVEFDGEEVVVPADRFWATPGQHSLVLSPKQPGVSTVVPTLPVLTAGGVHVVQVPEATAAVAAAPVVPEPTKEESQRAPADPASEVEPSARGLSNGKIAALAVGAGGVALLLTGAITGGVALGKGSALDDVCNSKNQCPREEQSRVDKANRLSTTTNVLLATGGVALAAGAVWFFFFPRKSEAQAHVSVAPVVTMGAVGIDVNGRY